MSKPLNQTPSPSISAPSISAPSTSAPSTSEEGDVPRRAILRKLGRYAAVTPPAVTLLLAAKAKPAAAASPVPVPVSSRQLKNREGDVDGAVLSSALAGIGEGVAIDMIDGVGICLAAIKALSAKVESLEAKL